MLVMLKNSGAWEMLSNIFYVKTATFIKTITNFVPVVAPQLYVDWVKEKVQEESMRMLVTSDPTAQHKLYGYKVEANEALHHATRSKTDKDRMLLDTGLLSAEYPDEWAVFAGKGRTTECGHLERSNHRRELVWKVCRLWRICADKYRWAEDFYDDIFQTCAALTKYHIGFYRLRATNGEEYNQRQSRLIAIGREKQKKWRLAQERYRERRRLRQRMSLDSRQ
ncbi:hypothetical protein PF007_g24142 [Phytophthora fragariae]|uniref:DDE Tnp4 domain-containing protein n=1 Tax=Phytophthora fragariae TaxID=53985 RepID=A0A6A3IBI9_9STRA|nr:hypothetical protein PF011_g23073 [Phytophthora fragariae]KAE9077704.1 hypothetical protein PF007_g24142 [Phytophthora fragariae]KAE9186674.1 hypothetical protein PF004_g23018 [Phytophthora fragariae]